MLVMMTADLAKPEAMDSKDFFEVWRQESVAAIEAVKAGAIKAIWKVAGEYQVIAVMDLDNGDQIDEIVHNLPIWRLGHAHLVPRISWKPLRPYENWAQQLETLAKG
ncbi:MAG: muconolactone Delta-isomerase family protein [Gammaproteobacteria bacterium]|jgi:muconolactone delta-isomerase